jgi:hypothetical protein
MMKKKVEGFAGSTKVPALAAVLALLGGWCAIFAAI